MFLRRAQTAQDVSLGWLYPGRERRIRAIPSRKMHPFVSVGL
jgi:hypothetical protein